MNGTLLMQMLPAHPLFQFYADFKYNFEIVNITPKMHATKTKMIHYKLYNEIYPLANTRKKCTIMS